MKLSHIMKALSINSTDTYALGNGLSLDILNRTEEAINYYDKVLAINSTDTYALNNKGYALINLGRINEAITYLDKGLLIDPNDAFILDSKGYALYKLGRYEEAITYFDRALSIDPTYTEALHNKDLVLQVMRQGNQSTIEEEQQQPQLLPQQEGQQPRRIAYGLPQGDTPFIRLFHEQFAIDNINVIIAVDASTYQQSSKYIEIVKAAINKWSEYSKKFPGWDGMLGLTGPDGLSLGKLSSPSCPCPCPCGPPPPLPLGILSEASPNWLLSSSILSSSILASPNSC
jgi:tetratricopeptide (TPR) repeat protein